MLFCDESNNRFFEMIVVVKDNKIVYQVNKRKCFSGVCCKQECFICLRWQFLNLKCNKKDVRQHQSHQVLNWIWICHESDAFRLLEIMFSSFVIHEQNGCFWLRFNFLRNCLSKRDNTINNIHNISHEQPKL